MTQRLVLLIADISGYTRFMLEHAKAQAHAQMIVGVLLEAMIEQSNEPFELAKIEGDAVFLYARKDGPEASAELARELGQRIRVLFGEFDSAARALAASAICRCDACANIDKLGLKVIAHSGEAVIADVGGYTEVSGLDVILVHRLLKNDLPWDEYVLLTDAARADIDLGDDAVFEQSEEHDDDFGRVPVHTLPGDRVARTCLTCNAAGVSGLSHRIIRHEIKSEYRAVATEPEKGFHFHTGRDLADILGYPESDIEAVPSMALESFAGTGNPFSLGEIESGERVVDIGCGTAFDTLIAARKTGASGRVLGVDMTTEMVGKARRAVDEAGANNVTVVIGYAENLPAPDAWADVIISNGVLNLCPDKASALAEMHRVLRPGGRLQIGDILVEKPVPESAKGDLDLWAG